MNPIVGCIVIHIKFKQFSYKINCCHLVLLIQNFCWKKLIIISITMVQTITMSDSKNTGLVLFIRGYMIVGGGLFTLLLTPYSASSLLMNYHYSTVICGIVLSIVGILGIKFTDKKMDFIRTLSFFLTCYGLGLLLGSIDNSKHPELFPNAILITNLIYHVVSPIIIAVVFYMVLSEYFSVYG